MILQCGVGRQPSRSATSRSGSKKAASAVSARCTAAMRHAVQLVGLALMAGFAVSLLWSEAQLVELNESDPGCQGDAGQ